MSRARNVAANIGRGSHDGFTWASHAAAAGITGDGRPRHVALRTRFATITAGALRSMFTRRTLKVDAMATSRSASPTDPLDPSPRSGGRVSADLGHAEIERYSRHLILPEVGIDGQKRLRSARVLVVGAGGLGSPAALYLAAAGVGTMGIVDFDTVDTSNLHRQLLHGAGDVGRRKVDSARDRLRDVNPYVELETHDFRLESSNALEVIGRYDIAVDGTDNFATRYLVNDACVMLGKPNVHGAIFRFDGQVSVFGAENGPCYRCLFPQPPPPGMVPGCAEAGVLGVLPGIVGTIQAVETVKLILGIGEPLVGRLLLFDALGMKFNVVRIRRDPACPACGTRELRELIDYEEFCGGGAAGTEGDDTMEEMTPAELSARMAEGSDIELIDVREAHELRVASIPGARHIPLGEFQAAIPTLDPTREYVIMCRSGARSARAAAALQEAGFDRVFNLAGGILRWSDEVDPTVRKY
jgi:sulfur-carrier protein adenylyltransferase/sulfurtransferase